MDCIGDYNDFSQIGLMLDELLQRHNAEFIEIYAAGLPDSLFQQAGMTDAATTTDPAKNFF